MGKINILNDAGTNKLTLEFNGTSDSTINSDGLVNHDLVTVDTSGNVGIGTSSPSSPLHIASSSGNTILNLQRTNTNSGGNTGTIAFKNLNDDNIGAITFLGTDTGGELVFRSGHGAAQSSPFNLTTNLSIKDTGEIDFGTWSHPATTYWKNTSQTSRTLRFGTYSDNSASYFGPLNDSDSNQLIDLGTSDGKFRNGYLSGNMNIGGNMNVGNIIYADSIIYTDYQGSLAANSAATRILQWSGSPVVFECVARYSVSSSHGTTIAFISFAYNQNSAIHVPVSSGYSTGAPSFTIEGVGTYEMYIKLTNPGNTTCYWSITKKYPY